MEATEMAASAVATGPAFHWQPLVADSQFRLLSLRAQDDQDGNVNLTWRLEHVQLDDNISYQALSYTWGGQQPTEDLLCNGSTLKVSKTVKHFLDQVFRPGNQEQLKADPTSCAYLFIDALCIDQSNDVEKSIQVGLIGQIFKKAQNVVMWLGPGTPDNARALQFLSGIVEFLDSCYDQGQEHLIGRFVSEIYRDGLPITGLTALSKLMGNAYFSRTWIVQEVAVASNLHMQIGEQRLEWQTFATACERIIRNPTIFGGFNIPTNVLHVASMRREFLQAPLSMLRLLSSTWHFQCFDSRDKIFALLGLSDQRNKTADYTHDADAIFHSFAISCLHRGEINWILSSVTPRMPGNLPSWVPDWSGRRNQHRFMNDRFSAGGDEAGVLCNVSTDGLMLKLDGILLDAVDATVPSIDLNHPKIDEWFGPSSQGDVAQLLKALSLKFHDWIGQCERLITPSVTEYCGLPVIELLWRTLICDRDITGQKAAASHGEDFHHYRKGLQQAADISPSSTPASTELASRYRGTLSAAMECRSFARTQANTLAVVPETALAGDRVCILKGMKAPFVLRAREDGGYRMVGEAYVHGVMNGEALHDNFDKLESIMIY